VLRENPSKPSFEVRNDSMQEDKLTEREKRDFMITILQLLQVGLQLLTGYNLEHDFYFIHWGCSHKESEE